METSKANDLYTKYLHADDGVTGIAAKRFSKLTINEIIKELANWPGTELRIQELSKVKDEIDAIRVNYYNSPIENLDQ